MSTPPSLLCATALVAALAGCATVRQPDLDAWVGAPVEAMDTHPLFLTIPMYRTLTDSGVEIRNDVNSQEAQQCFTRVDAHHSDQHARGDRRVTRQKRLAARGILVFCSCSSVLKTIATARPGI